MEMSGPIHFPSALTLGKQSPVTIVQTPGWSPEKIWTFRRRKNLSFLPGIEPRIFACSIRRLFTVPRTLCWLFLCSFVEEFKNREFGTQYKNKQTQPVEKSPHSISVSRFMLYIRSLLLHDRVFILLELHFFLKKYLISTRRRII